MFRPTHFVILFAVVLCATAFPGPPADPVPQGPGMAPEAAGVVPKQSPASETKASGDLDTDAQTYWRYSYYRPSLDYTYTPSYVKSHAWGFGRAYGPYIFY